MRFPLILRYDLVLLLQVCFQWHKKPIHWKLSLSVYSIIAMNETKISTFFSLNRTLTIATNGKIVHWFVCLHLRITTNETVNVHRIFNKRKKQKRPTYRTLKKIGNLIYYFFKRIKLLQGVGVMISIIDDGCTWYNLLHYY